jgi:hypothetical protein
MDSSAAMALACTLQCCGALVLAFVPDGAARRLDAALAITLAEIGATPRTAVARALPRSIR